MDEQSYQDLSVAEAAMKVEGRTLVLVTEAKVFSVYTDHPVVQLQRDIDYLQDTVVGIEFLGKASALLCAYGRVRAVFTSQATKTALAVMIRAGIPCQTEKMIPQLPLDSPLFDEFEQRVQTIDEPHTWYQILTTHLQQSRQKKL